MWLRSWNEPEVANYHDSTMPIHRLMSDAALLQELGQRIARLRLERNLSQSQLAEQAGISKRTLERLEAGAAATQLSLFLRVLR
jgi:DNA-binding XRE family transcriptional regulator